MWEMFLLLNMQYLSVWELILNSLNNELPEISIITNDYSV